MEQEEAVTTARDLGALVQEEAGVLGRLQDSLAQARAAWGYTTTLLDSRNFARNAAREALAADRAAAALSSSAFGMGLHTFLPPPPPNTLSAGSGLTCEYAPLLEELCELTGESGGTAEELWGVVRASLEPLLCEASAALAPSGPPHSSPASAGKALSLYDVLVDLLEEELGSHRARVLAMPPTASLPPSATAYSLSASLDSLRRGNPIVGEVYLSSSSGASGGGGLGSPSGVGLRAPPAYAAYLKAL